jgi:hypothetical protein
MAGAILSSGCATMVAIVACVQDHCPDERVMSAAGKVDGDIFGAVFGSKGLSAEAAAKALFERVSVEGVVTSSGTPLYQARVELSLGSEVWMVRTDRSGRYQIQGSVKPGRCWRLRFTIQHPDRRAAYRFPVECGEQRLDFDLPAE